MRLAIPVAAALAAFGSPAYATIGLLCTVNGTGPAVSIVFGAGADGGIAAVNLKEGAAWRSSFHKEDRLVLTRSSVVRPSVEADFLDKRQPQRRGSLRVRISGYTASGTLSFNGRTYKVRCIQD